VKLYRTYNCVAVTFLVAVSGFMCVLMLGTDPQGAEPVTTDSWVLPIPVTHPTLTEDPQLAQADDAEIQGDLNVAMASDTVENLGQELSLGDSPIEFNTDNSGDSANLASTIEVNGGSNTGVVASNYSGYPSSSGSVGTGGSSGPYSSGNTTGGSSGNGTPMGNSGPGSGYGSGSGSGSGTVSGSGSGSGAGTGTGLGSGTGTGTGGSGGSGKSNGGSIFPNPGTDPGTGTGSGTGTGTGSGSGTGTGTGSGTGTDGGTVSTDNVLPEWIDIEGIRGGFITSTAGNLTKIPRYVETMTTMGLNTAIVYGCSFAETPSHLTYYREWLRLCNQAGLHVFAYYPWQPPVGNSCRPVVFSDGTEGLFPCPLDNQLWQKYLEGDLAVKLATVSVEGPMSSFDGYFLDMEMYRTENEPDAKKHYSFDTCFCDICFSRFILNRTPIRPQPTVRSDQRKAWLLQHGFLPDYYAYLIEQVESKTEQLKSKVRAINPKLLFGVYPALNDTNWVRNAFMRALGRDSYPVISFSTDTYGYLAVPWGANRIPSDMSAYFERYNINGIYAAGYMLRKYTSAEIGTQIIRSYQRSQGYWLYQMSQLVEDQVSEAETLAGGSRSDYVQAIQEANAALQGDE